MPTETTIYHLTATKPAGARFSYREPTTANRAVEVHVTPAGVRCEIEVEQTDLGWSQRGVWTVYSERAQE